MDFNFIPFFGLFNRHCNFLSLRFLGGGGSKSVPVPVYQPEPVVLPEPIMPEQRAVTAQPVVQLMSEAEERNKKYAAALLTQDWLKPPTLGVPGIQQRRDVLGL